MRSTRCPKAGLLILAVAGLAHADIVFTGSLDPAHNSNLTYWEWDPVSPGYTTPRATGDDRAYNIALHSFLVDADGPVTFSRFGYGQDGGFDSVLAVFRGTGNAAEYMSHGYGPVPGDFDLTVDLTAGLHTLAVSMFMNEPCAAGFCFVDGSFADGYTNLVNYDSSRPNPLIYHVKVDGSVSRVVPEPAPPLILLSGLLAATVAVKRRIVEK